MNQCASWFVEALEGRGLKEKWSAGIGGDGRKWPDPSSSRN